MLSGAGWLIVHRVLFSTVLPLPCSPVLLLGSPWSWSGHPLDRSGNQVNITPTILAKLKVRNSTNPQGHMLAASSNCDTVSRNCGVFWSIFQIAPALAALLVWALWDGEEESGTVKYPTVGALNSAFSFSCSQGVGNCFAACINLFLLVLSVGLCLARSHPHRLLLLSAPHLPQQPSNRLEEAVFSPHLLTAREQWKQLRT